MIANNIPNLRSMFFRPGFLHDSSRSFTVPLAAMTSVAAMINGATGNRLEWLMGAGGTRPSKANLMAQAVVEGIEEEDISGVINVDKIEELAHKAWRRGML
jgi:hypothetical protein